MRVLLASRNKRNVAALCLLICAAAAIALPYAKRRISERLGATESDQRAKQRGMAPASRETNSNAVEPQALATPPFDVSQSVVAGGGGSSSGTIAGTPVKVEGTIGQSAAGVTSNSSNGTFTVSGGFWQGATSTGTPPTNIVQFSSSSYSVTEACTTVTITVNRIGDTTGGAASVDYFTSDVTASERRDYITAIGRLNFGASETSKSFVVLINDDSYLEGTETFNVNLANPSGAGVGAAVATVRINDNTSEPATNLIDDPRDYVCQHYHDFLNRQPDQSGWDFWTNQITSCGTDAQCLEVRRINVSAAFYLSIEFQQTGYLVERLYKAAYGDAAGISTFPNSHQLPVPTVRFNEFLPDTQEIGLGVVVGQTGWEQKLESNKQAFAAAFVQRPGFLTAFPLSMPPPQFVDTLFSNAGIAPSASERQDVLDEFGGAGTTSDPAARARALRRVAENPALTQREFNRAFVLMQYLGYLRRNSNDPPDSDYTGFDFWLTKLNAFNGNFQDAEMVKAFITSIEYRQRFGP